MEFVNFGLINSIMHVPLNAQPSKSGRYLVDETLRGSSGRRTTTSNRPMVSSRNPSPSSLFRNRTARQGRLRRWKRKTLNWLNGIPTKEYDVNDNYSLNEEIWSDQRKKNKKIKSQSRFKKWRSKGEKKELNETIPEEGINDLAGSIEMVKENRPPVRIIQIPPELINASVANRKDDVHFMTIPNEIHTAKYTTLNFLPKNILEQMRRVANIYFVIIVILQCFPAISNYNPILSAAPIVIIMAITAAKDAVEDWRRHQQDKDVNFAVGLILNRPGIVNLVDRDTRWKRIQDSCAQIWNNFVLFVRRQYCTLVGEELVLTGENKVLVQIPTDSIDWKETFWRDMRVGDIVFVRNNEMLPADVLILSTSEPESVCFVETKNLDGETNLKIRRGPCETEWIRGAKEASNLRMTMEVDIPNSNLYTFTGRIIIEKEVSSPFIFEDQKFPNESFISGASQIDTLSQLKASMVSRASGSMFLEPSFIPINNEGILLRGCILRNTEWIIGVIIYTGSQTKLMLNSGGTPSKRTRIERQMNPQIILNFLLLFIICISCAIVQTQMVSSAANAPYNVSTFKNGLLTSSVFLGFLTFWSSLILFQTLVPISMYVTVEIIKTAQAFFINNDRKLYHPETNTRAVPRAWNLADDLGQIEYLFSDKTGTLTQNVMEFRKCSINGIIYGDDAGSLTRTLSQRTQISLTADNRRENEMMMKIQGLLSYSYVPPLKYSFVDSKIFDHIVSEEVQRQRIFDFFLLLIVCHTVLIDYDCSVGGVGEAEDTDQLKTQTQPHFLIFKAQSPDEAALVAAARDLGFVFLGRDKDIIYVSVLGEIEPITVLNVIEFSSDRKRMSIIVKRRSGQLMLFSKGADNVIFERLSSVSAHSEAAALTLQHLQLFAEDGLRTLCLAAKFLSEDYYREWLSRYNEASAAMSNRELLMDAIADEIERDLDLLGATAIEDRLQDGVPECIQTLQQAGIKIWVLTGDKLETAINIGFSCRLLNRRMILLVIKGVDEEETLKQLRSAYERIWGKYFCFGQQAHLESGDLRDQFALIIEGSTLKHALGATCRKVFVNLSSRCSAVICCRVSPLQKAQVVSLMKRSKNVMTMAIGDGANDVSMIQAADVGIGICGQEGMQAVMSSDYAIAQFRYLTRLLLVHGRWSYLRVAEVTLCSLYKNIAFVVLLYWYQFYCGFTAQYVYDYMYLLFFNLLFSILPLLLLGVFDRDLTDEQLVKIAPIYKMGIQQRSYSLKLFGYYILDALYQSLVCFFVTVLTYQDEAVSYFGQGENQTLLGNVMALSVITCTNLYTMINAFSWFPVMYAGLALTMFTILGMMILYSFFVTGDMYGTYLQFVDPIFWLTIILCVAIALSPRCILKYIQREFRPNDLDIVREVYKWGINEASLLGTLVPPSSTSRRDLSMISENQVTAPPKAVTRSMSKKYLGMDWQDEMINTNDNAPFIPEGIGQSSFRQTLWEKSLKLFNLKTGRFESMTGYAFSQEAGMGQVVNYNKRRKSEHDPFGAKLFRKNKNSSPPMEEETRKQIIIESPSTPEMAARTIPNRRQSKSKHYSSGSVSKRQ